jgi:hypothetical protein
MDNIESGVPQGGEDVTSSQGQTPTDTQPTAPDTTLDGGSQPTEGTASNPWDNDPKFKGKAPEDIYKAYQEVEKLTGQLSQKAQVANLLEEKYGVTPDQLASQIEQLEEQQRQARYANDPLAPIHDEVNSLKQIIHQQEAEKALIEEERALDNFLKENPAYAPQRDKILQLGLTTEMDKPYDQIAREWFGDVRAQGQKDAYNKIESKIMSQPTGSQSQPQKSFTAEDMKNMSTAEMESFLQRA